jgi:hypothetical protein
MSIDGISSAGMTKGGWGIGGHANTNADIAAAARAALAGR